MRIIAIDLFATHKGMLYSTPPKLSLIKDTSLDVHLLTPESKYLLVETPEIELSAPEPFGVDKPAPTLAYPRPFTPPISPNLPTHSESLSPSSPLTPPKRSSVKIEEVKDDKDKDVKMHSPSPSSPEAGLS